MTGVDQNGNKVDTYVNAKLYYTTASRVWEEWVYDRTYVKLREVSLSYVFPSQTLKKLNIGQSRASVAINASNPWLIYSACPNVAAKLRDKNNNLIYFIMILHFMV